MVKDKESDRLVILRFKNQDEIRKFFSIFKENNLGSIVKVGSNEKDELYKNNKSKNHETFFTKLGMGHLDRKKSDKPSLGTS